MDTLTMTVRADAQACGQEDRIQRLMMSMASKNTTGTSSVCPQGNLLRDAAPKLTVSLLVLAIQSMASTPAASGFR